MNINVITNIKPVLSIDEFNGKNQGKSIADSFANIISEVRKADKKLQQGIVEETQLHELVTDISLIETNLKVLVAIRDSLMNAIQEVTRMQV